MRCAPLVGTAHPVRPLRRPTSASARVRHSRSSLCLKYGPLESALFKNKETRPSAPTRPLRSPPGRSQRTDHHLGRLARFVFERGAPLFRSTPTTAPRLTACGSQGCIKDAFFLLFFPLRPAVITIIFRRADCEQSKPRKHALAAGRTDARAPAALDGIQRMDHLRGASTSIVPHALAARNAPCGRSNERPFRKIGAHCFGALRYFGRACVCEIIATGGGGETNAHANSRKKLVRVEQSITLWGGLDSLVSFVSFDDRSLLWLRRYL